MIRLEFLLRRRAGMSFDDFQRYWRDEHARLVASLANKLDVVRYVQVHTLDDGSHDAARHARGEMEPAYDGVAELWWESEDALRAAFGREPEAGSALLEDERRFIDLPKSPSISTWSSRR